MIGVDVLVVLGVGLLLAGLFGFALKSGCTPAAFSSDIYAGFEEGMFEEITLLSLLIGGLAASHELRRTCSAHARSADAGQARRLARIARLFVVHLAVVLAVARLLPSPAQVSSCTLACSTCCPMA